MKLLQIDTKTFINPKYIVQITITNINDLRRERQQFVQTPEQRERLEDKYWEVNIYLKSETNGYNPQRLNYRFQTQKEATDFVKQFFGPVIVQTIKY